MSRAALAWCIAVSLSVPPPSTLGVQAEAPAGDEDSQFEEPANLADALERSLAAVREAEEGGPQAQEKLKEARFYSQTARRLDPANAKAEYIFGRMNILIGRSRDAFSQINKYVQTPEGANDWEAFRVLGQLYFASGYYEQAQAKFARAAELNSQDEKTLLGLSKTATKLGRRLQAVDAARIAVKQNPSSADAQVVLAEALAGVELLDQAKMAVEAAIDHTLVLLRDDPGNDTLLAKLNLRHQLYQQILSALIRRDPAVAQPYLDMAQSVLAQAEVQRALTMNQVLRLLEQGITDTAPNTPAGLKYEYAGLATAVGRHDQAVTVLEELLEIDPTDDTARKMLDRIKAQQADSSAAPTGAPAEATGDQAPPALPPS